MSIVLYNIRLGQQRFTTQMIRFALNAILCIYLYLGANWARWVGSVLYVIGGISGLVAGASLLTTGIAVVPILLMGVIYIASACILLFVPAVKMYFGAELK